MKKRDLKKLALLGLTSGMLVATQTCLQATDTNLSTPPDGLPEAELLSQLSPEAQLLYMGLDQEGQALARLITSDRSQTQGMSRGHGCGGSGGCGGGGGGVRGMSSHSCGGAGGYSGGGVVYQGGHGCGGAAGGYSGGQGGHGCGGGAGGYGGDGVVYQGGHGCGGAAGGYGGDGVMYQGGPVGSHSCSGTSSHCAGRSHCGGGAPGQPQGQPVNPQKWQSNQPTQVSQPGQPQSTQPTNRSMPQFENQPRYQQQDAPQIRTAPVNKPTAYLEQPAKQGRYVATVAVTEQTIESELNSEGTATYKALSPEGKKLAVKLSNQSCTGKNSCKGLNSCKSADNDCAGKGGCKGTTPGPFKDKNQAVKVASMKEKRQTALRGY